MVNDKYCSPLKSHFTEAKDLKGLLTVIQKKTARMINFDYNLSNEAIADTYTRKTKCSNAMDIIKQKLFTEYKITNSVSEKRLRNIQLLDTDIIINGNHDELNNMINE